MGLAGEDDERPQVLDTAGRLLHTRLDPSTLQQTLSAKQSSPPERLALLSLLWTVCRAKVKRNSERISTTTETPLMSSDLVSLVRAYYELEGIKGGGFLTLQNLAQTIEWCSCLTSTWSRLQTRLGELDAEIKVLVHRSEELGETGDVDAAQAAATRADRLKVKFS